jgi:hypothetical protein
MKENTKVKESVLLSLESNMRKVNLIKLLYEDLTKNKNILGYSTTVSEDPDGILSIFYKHELIAQVYFNSSVRLFVPKKITKGVIDRYNRILDHLQSYVSDIESTTVTGQFVMHRDPKNKGDIYKAERLKNNIFIAE